ncbi:FAD-dependent oxidoreductase [Streptomyces sp. NPDC051286]|uniref:FAD-dependent oxidoreductase n=1 Tax=Streptomyces sp. NPDC051286 TaxID=3365647 RepID=UPI0037875690
MTTAARSRRRRPALPRARPDGSVRTLTARHAVVVGTGSAPFVPDVPGLRAARPWTSRDVTHLQEIPQRVAVLGGGVVACEAATWLRGLGVEELTVIVREAGLLERLEPFASELVAAALEGSGVRLMMSRGLVDVRREAVDDAKAGTLAGIGFRHGGPATLTLDDGTEVTVDEIVVATGRVPRTDDIGLSYVGLRDGGLLEVDDHQAVKGVDGEWLYAIGDVCGKARLTHMGKYQARIVGEVIAARAGRRPEPGGFAHELSAAPGHRAVPQVTFTEPEVASVGLTERAAVAAGYDVETVEYDMAALAGTYLLRDEYVGRAKLVIDRAADTLLGATFVGSGVADLLHSATVAVVGWVPLTALWHAVPSYPTPSEVWLRLLEEFNRRRRLGGGDR